jgi:hypothetical protein
MDCFITRVLVNFDENLTHWLCRRLNTYDCLIRVKLWSQPEYLLWGNYFNIMLVTLVQLETGELYTEKINSGNEMVSLDLEFLKVVAWSLVVCTTKEGSDCATCTTFPQQIGPIEDNPTIS